jgi:hypothetical protein
MLTPSKESRFCLNSILYMYVDLKIVILMPPQRPKLTVFFCFESCGFCQQTLESSRVKFILLNQKDHPRGYFCKASVESV